MNFELTEIFSLLVNAMKQFFNFLRNTTFTVNGTTVSYFSGFLAAFVAEQILSALLKRKDDDEL